MTLVLTLPLGDIAGWVGALTGVLALTWRIRTWRRSGGWVKVTRGQSSQLWGDERPLEMLFVKALNVGSAPIMVTDWGVSQRRSKKNLTLFTPEGAPTPLPHRLEPGAELNLYAQAHHLQQATSDLNLKLRDMRAWVELATRQKLNVKRGVPVRAQ